MFPITKQDTTTNSIQSLLPLPHSPGTIDGSELVTNWFFPSNFTEVQLQPPKIQATNFKQTSPDSATVQSNAS